MDAQVMALRHGRSDQLRGPLVSSMVLHAVLLLTVLTYTMIHRHVGSSGLTWGSGAVKMGAVTTLPGIPLPTPLVQTSNTVATESLGVHKVEPDEREKPAPEAQEIPKFKEAEKPKKFERINKRIHKTEETPPDNAIPSTESGAPAMNYTHLASATGTMWRPCGTASAPTGCKRW